MYLLVMVLDDVSHLEEVLNAWVSVGVRGVTVLECTGLHRVLHRRQAHAAYMGFSQLFAGGQIGNNTLFAVIESLDIAEAAVAATENIIGSLNNANTGIVFVLPVLKTWGIPEPQTGEDAENAG
ncbi:MAG TPA: hypothetical protein PK801_02465 [Aggregatilineales bacterium]|nr:hypothetical protein [Chloroflexota bacterium]HOA25080.1 hypothetical protein [Aggregatilineales bacterium]HPV07319.1 hypothetical protein [Aggregatilineales bacterium]HQA67158.1 hypothetical protein [Aggregatilineales bacterium]HQE18831.1 hypothetical protein [Aggregatilineales bacterium]